MGIAAGSLLALAFRVFSMFLWAAVGVLTARTLSVEERGVYASVIVVTSAIVGIGSFSSATGFFVSNRHRPPAEVATNGAMLGIGLGALLLAGGAASWLFVGGAFGHLAALGAIAMFPALIRGSWLGVLLGSNRLAAYNAGANLQVFLGFFLLAGWVGVLGHRSAEAALAAWAVAQYLGLLPFLSWARPWVRWARAHGGTPELMRGLIRFSLVTGAGGAVALITNRVDLLLVVALDSEAAAGIYSVAISVTEALLLFSAAIAVATYARVGGVGREEAGHLTATGIRHTMMVVVAGAAGAALFAPVAVELLFGARYSEAATPLRIMCLGAVMSAPGPLLHNYFTVQLGRPAIGVWLASGACLVNVTAAVLLIPPFGTTGAACATVLTSGVGTAAAVLLFLRLSGVPGSELWRVRRADIVSYLDLARSVLRGRVFRPAPATLR